MIWGRNLHRKKGPLVYVHEGFNITQDVYRRDILKAVVPSLPQQHFGNVLWTFQQDSAPAPGRKAMHVWCRANLSDFITPAEWPPHFRIRIRRTTACDPFWKPRSVASVTWRSLRNLCVGSGTVSRSSRPIAEMFIKGLDLCICAKTSHFESSRIQCCLVFMFLLFMRCSSY